MENKNENQSYKSEINNEDNMSSRGNSNNKNKNNNYKCQSNTLITFNKLEKHEESPLKRKSHKVPLSQYYEELSKIYSNFLNLKDLKYQMYLMQKIQKNF